jgi:hypothetical protein
MKVSRRELAKLLGRSSLAASFLPLNRLTLAQQATTPTLVGQSAESLIQVGLPVNVEVRTVYNDPVERAVYMAFNLVNSSSEAVSSVQVMVQAFNDRGECVAGDFRTIDRLDISAGGSVSLETQLSNFLYAPDEYRRYVACVLWGTWASSGWWRERTSIADLQQAMRTQMPLQSGLQMTPMQGPPPGGNCPPNYCATGGGCQDYQKSSCCNANQHLAVLSGSCNQVTCNCGFTCGGTCTMG